MPVQILCSRNENGRHFRSLQRCGSTVLDGATRPYEVRFETPAGVQAQVDFARFVVDFTDDPGSSRIVWLFSLVLGHSRFIFARYVMHQDLQTLLRCHMQAFDALGGVPIEILYDRMKTAVTGEDDQGHIVYNRSLLARMGALLDIEARPARSPVLNDLKDLHMAREALVKNRTAAKNRAKNLSLAILKRHNAEQLRQIKRQMAAIEKEIMALIEAEPDLSRRFDILVSIPGVSAITAFALIIDMPELGTLGNGQAASLAGLAPVARQSGQWTGRAFIRGGRANVRKALYMPALVAMRFNPDPRPTTTGSSQPANPPRRPLPQSCES